MSTLMNHKTGLVVPPQIKKKKEGETSLKIVKSKRILYKQKLSGYLLQ